MKKINSIFAMLSVIGLALFSNSVISAPKSTITLKITADKPQTFFGTYLINGKLTYLNQKTPYEMKFEGDEIRLMIAGEAPDSIISADVSIRDQNGKGGSSSAKSHTIYLCESNVTVGGPSGKNSCELSLIGS